MAASGNRTWPYIRWNDTRWIRLNDDVKNDICNDCGWGRQHNSFPNEPVGRTRCRLIRGNVTGWCDWWWGWFVLIVTRLLIQRSWQCKTFMALPTACWDLGKPDKIGQAVWPSTPCPPGVRRVIEFKQRPKVKYFGSIPGYIGLSWSGYGCPQWV